MCCPPATASHPYYIQAEAGGVGSWEFFELDPTPPPFPSGRPSQHLVSSQLVSPRSSRKSSHPGEAGLNRPKTGQNWPKMAILGCLGLSLQKFGRIKSNPTGFGGLPVGCPAGSDSGGSSRRTQCTQGVQPACFCQLDPPRGPSEIPRWVVALCLCFPGCSISLPPSLPPPLPAVLPVGVVLPLHGVLARASTQNSERKPNLFGRRLLSTLQQTVMQTILFAMVCFLTVVQLQYSFNRSLLLVLLVLSFSCCRCICLVVAIVMIIVTIKPFFIC